MFLDILINEKNIQNNKLIILIDFINIINFILKKIIQLYYYQSINELMLFLFILFQKF
jgi:hypothetical protein